MAALVVVCTLQIGTASVPAYVADFAAQVVKDNPSIAESPHRMIGFVRVAAHRMIRSGEILGQPRSIHR